MKSVRTLWIVAMWSPLFDTIASGYYFTLLNAIIPTDENSVHYPNTIKSNSDTICYK